MSDDLVARIHGRDAQAIADFIAAHRPQLMAFIERQLGAGLRRKVEPDDVFQETSAEAVRALPTAELGDRDPFSWLCQIAERRIIDVEDFNVPSRRRADLRNPAAHLPRADDPDALDVSYSHNAFEKHRG